MSEASPADLAKQLREATLSVVWRQWSTIGAMATSADRAKAIVDPEALVLMSLWMLEHERRLGDVVWSWACVNSSLLSIQRLGNLRRDFPTDVGRHLSGLAERVLLDTKDRRWQSLRVKQSLPLGERSNKKRAAQPALTSWSTLMLQLRAGMGVGVKADVLAFVLGFNPQHAETWSGVPAISDALGYTPAAVRRAAEDLARARFIHQLETGDGERRVQRLFSGPADKWAKTLGITVAPPGWGFWRERFLFAVDALTFLAREAERATSDYARDVRSREILKRHDAALRREPRVDPYEMAGAEPDFAYLAATVRSFVALARNI